MLQSILTALHHQLIKGDVIGVRHLLQSVDKLLRHADGLVGVLGFLYRKHTITSPLLYAIWARNYTGKIASKYYLHSG